MGWKGIELGCPRERFGHRKGWQQQKPNAMPLLCLKTLHRPVPAIAGKDLRRSIGASLFLHRVREKMFLHSEESLATALAVLDKAVAILVPLYLVAPGLGC